MNDVSNDLTANLLTAWRHAERAAAVARTRADQATEAAEAAEAAAAAARTAAEGAGISLEAAETAVGKARNAYHQRESNVAADEADPPQGGRSVLEPG